MAICFDATLAAALSAPFPPHSIYSQQQLPCHSSEGAGHPAPLQCRGDHTTGIGAGWGSKGHGTQVQGLVAESLVSPEKCYTGTTVFFMAGVGEHLLQSTPSLSPCCSLHPRPVQVAGATWAASKEVSLSGHENQSAALGLPCQTHPIPEKTLGQRAPPHNPCLPHRHSRDGEMFHTPGLAWSLMCILSRYF